MTRLAGRLLLLAVLALALACLAVRASDAAPVAKSKTFRHEGTAGRDTTSRDSRSASNYGGVSASVRARVRREIRRQFPASEWRWAYCVVGRESGWNPRAVSRTNDHGLFQLNIIHASYFTRAGMWGLRYTIRGGTRMAYLLWRAAGRSPWYGGHRAC
jgi:hypothetical protein